MNSIFKSQEDVKHKSNPQMRVARTAEMRTRKRLDLTKKVDDESFSNQISLENRPLNI